MQKLFPALPSHPRPGSAAKWTISSFVWTQRLDHKSKVWLRCAFVLFKAKDGKLCLCTSPLTANCLGRVGYTPASLGLLFTGSPRLVIGNSPSTSGGEVYGQRINQNKWDFAYSFKNSNFWRGHTPLQKMPVKAPPNAFIPNQLLKQAVTSYTIWLKPHFKMCLVFLTISCFNRQHKHRFFSDDESV